MDSKFSTEVVILVLAALTVPLGFLLMWVTEKVKQHITGDYGYVAKKLLTGNEVDFYHRLRKALDPRWVVFPQVSMGALVNTKLLPAHPRYWDARQSFQAKICDFIICDARSLEPQLVVELDDRMHDFNKDKVRDTVMAMAGYRTIRFWSRNKPSVDELKVKLGAALALN